jgi:biotin transporter BioY
MAFAQRIRSATASHPVWFVMLYVVVSVSVEGALIFAFMNGFSREQLILVACSAALVSALLMATFAEFRNQRHRSRKFFDSGGN